MEFKGLTLDKFQEEAINSINSNNSVVVSAATGTGKTFCQASIIAETKIIRIQAIKYNDYPYETSYRLLNENGKTIIDNRDISFIWDDEKIYNKPNERFVVNWNEY